jgi:spore coat protein JB
MACEEQKKLLCKLQEMEFVAVELNLYLDTHPCDVEALNDFNCAVKMIKKIKKEYEEAYGPLMNFGMGGLTKEPWQWIDEPWPWEM